MIFQRRHFIVVLLSVLRHGAFPLSALLLFKKGNKKKEEKKEEEWRL